MTKKELTNLHSKHCTVEQVEANVGRGPETRIVVNMSLSQGEFMSLEHALIASVSPVAADVLAFLRNAKHDAGMP